MAVPAGRAIIARGYDVEHLHPLVDLINLMAYDLHGPWEDQTGPHTALDADGSSPSIRSAVEYWLLLGAPRAKVSVVTSKWAVSHSHPVVDSSWHRHLRQRMDAG